MGLGSTSMEAMTLLVTVLILANAYGRVPHLVHNNLWGWVGDFSPGKDIRKSQLSLLQMVN